MRWDQAKAVMIAVFLLLDAFLGWRLYASRATAVAPVPAASLISVGNVNVAASDVRFEGVLPAAPPSLPTLTIALRRSDAAAIALHLLGSDFQVESQGSIMTYAGSRGTVQYANGALLFQRAPGHRATAAQPPSAGRARFLADNFLSGMALAPADLVFDRLAYSQSQRAWDVAYYQRYQGQPVFNGRCDVMVDGIGVLSASCLWASVAGPGQSPRPILSPAEALQRLADAHGATAADPLLVDGVVLGYLAATYPANAAWPTVPVWRVQLADGSLYYVNAYTGTLVPGPA